MFNLRKPSHTSLRPIDPYGLTVNLCESDRNSDLYGFPGLSVATLRQAGFYSVLVRPGFRIIVLNTNVAYRFNL